VGYLGGRAAGGENTASNRWITFSHGLAFVLGFSVVFILLGVAASALGGILHDLSDWLARIGGAVVIVFGLHMIGVFRIPFLEYDTRVTTAPDRKWGYLSSALMGVFFSAGWSPCVGPVLGAILTLAANGGSLTLGASLLTAYSAGLAIPFLIAALGIGWVSTTLRKYGKFMRYVEIGMGVILVIVGVLLLTGAFSLIAQQTQFFWFDFGI
jgi:cytochrome c-type biogenesis protein